MGERAFETIDEILEGVVAETDDEQLHYQLNSARQLVEVARDRHEDLAEAVDDVDEAELRDRLAAMGYLD
ncbi:hypothetical protein [Haloarcula onubensis]|uniref:Uncharacterized protein n=1 Tax=Haloarcula onubensis TaxID=2950539 RepID=A0ABU2FJ60_9EURY|nr:hypothetical protein [Halomicroarcula sp. S3CR25-11]MDS0280773.1 hypothetical protein [Halomicroarcula sp. S3CR25-11]